ncbi:MAG TPA: beta-ketoacyl synthase N-terminal-like domain-containing protein, partial [Candidatus Krumholzibacteria bacterium]|nr:beta-ketoacyl synthase N-terminal-like domain-containing protein [Candidatus Krumholzibacteria bacterium]
MSTRVVVTGIGVVSAYGIGREAFWSGLAAGRSCARLLDFPGIENLPVRFAAPVPLRDEELAERLPNAKSAKTMSRAATFAMLAAVEAMQQSGLDSTAVDPSRVGTALGMGGLGLFDREYVERTFDVFARAYDAGRGALDRSTVWRHTLEGINPLTPLKALPNIATAHVAIQLDARGPSNTYTTACTSGAQAIGEAYRLVQRGECDVVIAGGADSMVNPNGMVAFTALGVLSQNNDEYQVAARPFDKRRDGFMLGEGAAVLILESLDCCRARGAQPLAEVMG